MGGKAKRDRLGEVYGAVTVVADDPGGWMIMWSCCGKREIVTVKRTNDIQLMPPKRCSACIQASPKSTAAERAAAHRAREKLKEKEKAPTVFEGIQGFWPYLGRMGFRHPD